ncbi:MAG: general secretion pathway protein GspB [Gammaproteobacteria bacterium]|nr:general secretion pathway protein GspB [Gammaproteobacteria bacterium]
MSFILDAVAKSEQERQRHEAPGPQVLALPVGAVPPSRSLLPYIVIGALVLNAALLIAWLQSERLLPSSPTELADPDLPSGNVVMTNPAPSVERRVGVGITVDTSAPEPDKAAAFEPPHNIAPSVTSGSAAGLGGELEEVIALEAQPETVAVREAKKELALAQPAATTAGEDTTAWIRIGPDTLSNRAAAGQPAMFEQGRRDAGTAPRRVSSLSELPVTVRNDLPKVVFSGHLYSSDPDSSMVFVDDGRPVTQGREIANELFLYEITPTGVIVEFRGYLIDVGVLQNWTLN